MNINGAGDLGSLDLLTDTLNFTSSNNSVDIAFNDVTNTVDLTTPLPIVFSRDNLDTGFAISIPGTPPFLISNEYSYWSNGFVNVGSITTPYNAPAGYSWYIEDLKKLIS